MKIITGKQVRPRRTMLYGVHGIGKSTWAAQAPKCLLLNLEDGLNDIDCTKTEHIATLDSVNECLNWLASAKHDFKSLAIDTVDWLEGMIHHDVAERANKATIADIGFGKGYKEALAYWDKLTFKLDWLRNEIGMNIILLAHTQIKRFDDPENESYDRYQPALHDLSSAMLQEWCDEVLFASYRTFVKKEDLGFNKERGIAIGGTERYIRTQESAACMAKNRLGMPSEIEFSWEEYAKWFVGSVSETKGE